MAGQGIAKDQGPQAFADAFGVSRETVARLELYARILQHWQRSINLVSGSTMDDLWRRHFTDSAQLIGFAPGAKTWLDLGSGAGFPGLVVAIMLAESDGVVVHLVESNAKKCGFLREVARQTRAPVDIHGTRIESLVDERSVESVDVVTARALAPMGKLFGYALPWLSKGATGLFLKGRDLDRELDEAKQNWRFDARLEPSLSDPSGRIAIISSVEPIREG